MTWDITVVSTLAQSYLHASGHSAADATELAVSQKETKYSCLPQSFLFVPVALETLGAIDSSLRRIFSLRWVGG